VIETTTDDIVDRIREIDGKLVLLDVDLADFYGVATNELRAMVRRNKAEFPKEFVIPVVLGGHRKRHLAFTEHGVIVAGSMFPDSSVEALSIHIVRAFVKLREANESHLDIAHRVEVLDEAVNALDATIREQFSAIYEALGMSVTTADPVPGLSPEQKPH
jgi:hypothetical protein